MKKLVWFIAAGVLGVSLVMADSDEKYEREENERGEYRYIKETPKRYSSKVEPLYKNECSACHMAYQAEFLPKRSWKKMMSALDDHFGVDASLDDEDRKKILNYLLENSADSKRVYGEFKEFSESFPKDKILLRISEVPYFKKEHRKISKKYIIQKEVKSISNCNACHQKADSEDYNERNIVIPNYGKWED